MSQPQKPSPRKVRGIGVLRGTVPWMFLTFVVAQGLNAVFSAIPGMVGTLRGWNAALLQGAQRLEPWTFAQMYWQKVTGNLPDMGPLALPFYLAGRAIGVGLEVILTTLADPAAAVPALVSYSLGYALTWLFFSDDQGEVNFLVGVAGTILLGAVALAVLQPLLVFFSLLSERLLGGAAGGVATLASIGTPLFWEFIKHLVQNRVEAVIDSEVEKRTPEDEVPSGNNAGPEAASQASRASAPAAPGQARTGPILPATGPPSKLATALFIAGAGLMGGGLVMLFTGLYDRFPHLGIGATVLSLLSFALASRADRGAPAQQEPDRATQDPSPDQAAPGG